MRERGRGRGPRGGGRHGAVAVAVVLATAACSGASPATDSASEPETGTDAAVEDAPDAPQPHASTEPERVACDRETDLVGAVEEQRAAAAEAAEAVDAAERGADVVALVAPIVAAAEDLEASLDDEAAASLGQTWLGPTRELVDTLAETDGQLAVPEDRDEQVVYFERTAWFASVLVTDLFPAPVLEELAGCPA